MTKKGGFAITHGKGFQVTFDNGVTVSVQFGPGNYCQNYSMHFGSHKGFDVIRSEDAEVAICKANGDWITAECVTVLGNDINDDVAGYILPKDVLAILAWAEAYKE